MNPSSQPTASISGVPLQCPQCRAPVIRDGESYLCAGSECRLRFPVVDGIPKFLIDDSEAVPLEVWRGLVSTT